MSVTIWALVILAGAIGQFVDTSVGMGFGVLSSSVMIAAGVSPALVVATVNVAKVGNGVFAAVSHAGFGNVRWRWVLPLAIPGVIGSVIGALLLVRLFNNVARMGVPILLLAMGLALLVRFVRSGVDTTTAEPADGEAAAANDTSWVVVAVIGFLGGAINAMTGGYGPFTTSSLLLLRGGHPRHAIGTVSMVEFIVAGTAAITLLSQIGSGDFLWQLPVALLIGGFLTAVPGAYVSRYLPARALGVGVGVSLVLLNTWAISRYVF